MLDIPKSDILEIVNGLDGDNLSFNGKTVLIYGYAGFLGGIFTSYLLHLNKEVLEVPCKIIAVDNYVLGQTPVSKTEDFYKVFNHDILLPIDDKLKDVKVIDYIVNFTSIASPSAYVRIPETVFDIGSIGTKNVLNFARLVRPLSILLMSSSEIYGGDINKVPFKEEYNVDISTSGARACYDCSKVALEVLSDIYFNNYNIPVKVIRPFNVVSAGLNLNDGRMIPSFVNSCLQDKPIKVYGKGAETRTICYGTDFMIGMVKVLLHGNNGHRYNLGKDTEEARVIDIANKIATFFNKPELVQHVPPALGYAVQPQNRRPDLSKIRNELGYNPIVSLDDIIKRYCGWASPRKVI